MSTNNPLNMSGLISGGFNSGFNVRFIPETTTFVDGIAVQSQKPAIKFAATVQPLNPKEIEHIGEGLDRIKDYRKIYVNDGAISKCESLEGHFEFLGSKWRFVSVDYRPRSSYLKAIVARFDE